MNKRIGRRRIGESLVRKEDLRFVKGSGQFTDDLNKPGQLYGYFVRSTVAHANIKKITINDIYKYISLNHSFKLTGLTEIILLLNNNKRLLS